MDKNQFKKMNEIAVFEITKATTLYYEFANDFENDIPFSYVRLAEKLANNGQKRDCYGIIESEKEKLTYKACLTQLSTDTVADIPTITIKKGKYLSIIVEDWKDRLMELGPTFDQLLKHKAVDINSPCIEYYKSETELICLVKKK